MTFPQFSKLSSSRLKRISIVVLATVAVVAALAYSMRSKPFSVQLQKVGRGDVEASVSNTRAGTVMACRRAQKRRLPGGRSHRS